jgi:archaellum biogenesis ATPase FlaH/5S rRNA maturation endonuclease (ribonuclease M5)
LIIPKEIITEAKEKLGEKAAHIIAKHFKIEQFDEKNLKGCCPFHHEKTGSFVWNPKENHFKCFGCSKVYGILDFYMDEGLTYLGACEKLFDEVGIKFKFGEKGVKTKREYKYPIYETNANREDVENYLQLRGISKDTLDYCDVKEDNHKNIVFNFYNANDVLMTVKYRPARKLKDKEVKTWCQKDADTSEILFNMNRIDPTQPLIITEGEIDCLSVIEAGYRNTVSIPLGAGNEHWIEENWDWLEQFDKIIIWSDNDEPGMKMRKNVIPRLGEWRCYVVELPNEVNKDNNVIKLKDANEVLYHFGKEKVLEYINDAKEVPISHVVDFSDVEDFDIDKAEGVYTGIKGIDKYLSKLFFGTFTIVTGVNGSGKSTFMNQVCVCEPLNQGYDVFCYSGELPHWQLKNWILYNLSGRRHIDTIIRQNQPDAFKVKPEIKTKISEHYRGRLYLYDNPLDRTAKTIINKMTELARKNGTKVFIIDNFTVVDLECDDKNKYEKQKEFIVNLVNFSINYNVLVVLVIHPHKLDSIRRMTKMDIQGTMSVTDLAHRVLGVHRVRPKEKEGIKNKKGDGYYVEPNPHDVMIDIFKDRMIGWEDVDIGVNYDRASRRFWTDLSELDKQYGWDKGVYKDKLPDPKDINKPDFMKG